MHDTLIALAFLAILFSPCLASTRLERDEDSKKGE
jgi:hypothetical protein